MTFDPAELRAELEGYSPVQLARLYRLLLRPTERPSLSHVFNTMTTPALIDWLLEVFKKGTS